MTYLFEWLVIVAAVVVTLSIGFLLNRYALRRRPAVGMVCTDRRGTNARLR